MSRVKTTGALKKYLHLPLVLTTIFVLINIGVYMLNVRAGLLVSCGLVLYMILIFAIYGRQKENMLNDLVTFAAQYGQIQRQLIMDLSLPYAISDDRGRLLWFNDAFAELTGKDRKSYRKSIAGIFNGLSPDKFPAKDQEIEYETVYDKRDYRIQIKSIVLLADEHDVIQNGFRDGQAQGLFISIGFTRVFHHSICLFGFGRFRLFSNGAFRRFGFGFFRLLGLGDFGLARSLGVARSLGLVRINRGNHAVYIVVIVTAIVIRIDTS
jgi:hypothetical protein